MGRNKTAKNYHFPFFHFSFPYTYFIPLKRCFYGINRLPSRQGLGWKPLGHAKLDRNRSNYMA
jgi:hypothetical protein